MSVTYAQAKSIRDQIEYERKNPKYVKGVVQEYFNKLQAYEPDFRRSDGGVPFSHWDPIAGLLFKRNMCIRHIREYSFVSRLVIVKNSQGHIATTVPGFRLREIPYRWNDMSKPAWSEKDVFRILTTLDQFVGIPNVIVDVNDQILALRRELCAAFLS